LGSLQREVGFHSVCNSKPQSLTPSQIDDFNRLGFIRPLTVLAENEANSLRQYFDEVLARAIAAGQDSYSISTAHMKYGRVYDLLTTPKIVDCVRDLLGENVIGWGSHFFCKMPGDGKQVSWHQDASYWPLSPTKTVTVWLAVDDADIENACMRFLAGSHLHGHLTFRPSRPEEHNVLNQTVDDVEQYGEPIDDILKAGQFSIHSDLLLHGSEPNDSTRRRCGLTLRYCSADVRADLGWNAKGVVVSGEDPSGHWGNPPRPAAD
jgi:non-heme Fe2+,alpha-ketoglutarate-dependent halogenase